MNTTTNEYTAPSAEIIAIDTEEVVALSGMGGGTPPNPSIAQDDNFTK